MIGNFESEGFECHSMHRCELLTEPEPKFFFRILSFYFFQTNFGVVEVYDFDNSNFIEPCERPKPFSFFARDARLFNENGGNG